MNDPMLPLPGLSPVSGKTVVAKFERRRARHNRQSAA
jgi:hypothetical protein